MQIIFRNTQKNPINKGPPARLKFLSWKLFSCIYFEEEKRKKEAIFSLLWTKTCQTFSYFIKLNLRGALEYPLTNFSLYINKLQDESNQEAFLRKRKTFYFFKYQSSLSCCCCCRCEGTKSRWSKYIYKRKNP